MSWKPAALLDASLQELPSKITVSPLDCETATQKKADAHDTEVSSGTTSSTVAGVAHDVPFQAVALPMSSTATQKESEAHDTDETAMLSPIDVQLVPLNDMAPCGPPATQKELEAQDTAATPNSGSTAAGDDQDMAAEAIEGPARPTANKKAVMSTARHAVTRLSLRLQGIAAPCPTSAPCTPRPCLIQGRPSMVVYSAESDDPTTAPWSRSGAAVAALARKMVR